MRTQHFLHRFWKMVYLKLYIQLLKLRQYRIILYDEQCRSETGDFRVQITFTSIPYIFRINVFDAPHLISTILVNHKVVEYRKQGAVFYVNCKKAIEPTEKNIEFYFAEISFSIKNPYYINHTDHTLLFNGPVGDEIRIQTTDKLHKEPYLLPAHFIVDNDNKISVPAVKIGTKIHVFWNQEKIGKKFRLIICKTPVGTTG